MGKPIIGLLPLYDIEQEKIWMRPNYLRAVAETGGLPLILPLLETKTDIREAAEFCDGFLFTGGPDVHPAIYKEDALRGCGVIDEKRDRLELLLLHEASLLDKPVFGICRGIQLMNVAFGGSLYQDIPAQAQAIPIMHSQQPPYHVPVHSVVVEKESPLYGIVKQEKMMVNSMHHQAVKVLAPPLRCAAKSKDGLVEALYLPERSFFIGVQWHPEWSYQPDNESGKLFLAFVNAAACECRKRKALGFCREPQI